MLIRSCIGVAAANTRICTAMATSSAYQRHQASRSLSSICHHRHGHGRMRHMVIPTPSSSHAHTHHDGSSQSWSWSRFRSISYTSSLRSSSSSATAAAAVAGGNDGAAVLTAPHISTLMRRLYLKVHPVCQSLMRHICSIYMTRHRDCDHNALSISHACCICAI